MPGPKLNLARTVVWWKVSPFPETLSIPTPALGTANVTVVLLGAIERMFLRRATFVPLTANVTGTTTTVQIQNFTKTLNLTADVAKVALPMVLTSDSNLLVLPKDVLVLQYNFGTATVGPGVA